MKAERIVCPHPNKKDENKPFWKEVGTILVDDALHAKLVERGERMTIFMNENPGVNYMVFFHPPKESKNEEPF